LGIIKICSGEENEVREEGEEEDISCVGRELNRRYYHFFPSFFILDRYKRKINFE